MPRRDKYGDRQMAMHVQLPLSLITVIDRIADSEDKPVREIITRVIRKGLEVERLEREMKVKEQAVEVSHVGAQVV